MSSDRAERRLVVSPDGRLVYLTSDRRFADNPWQAALVTRERSARLDGCGNVRCHRWRVPACATFETLGRAPR